MPFMENKMKTEKISFPSAPANVTDEGVAVPKNWYAACVRMNCERKVAALIDGMGVETYVPVQKSVRQWSDRKKTVEVVVIPLIVFVRCTEDEVKTVERLSAVSRLMRAPGQKQPARIPDNQIETLKFLLRQEDVAVEFSNKNFSKGDKVRVARGDFEGIEGTVVQHENGHYLAIEINIIGSALVKIDINDLTKI